MLGVVLLGAVCRSDSRVCGTSPKAGVKQSARSIRINSDGSCALVAGVEVLQMRVCCSEDEVLNTYEKWNAGC
jgi:hypothetical protein